MSVDTNSPAVARCPVNHGYDPFEQSQRDDPYTWLREVRAHEAVFFSPAIGMWVVTRYADADHVLRHPEIFSSENAVAGVDAYNPEVVARLAGEVPLTATLIGMDRPDHTRLRRIVNAAFTPSRVARMEDDVRAIAVELIEGLPADRPFDVLKEFSYPLTLTVIARVIGIPEELVQLCHDLSERWNDLIGADARGVPLDDQLKCADDALEYHRIIGALIAEREHKPADDLITAVWEVRRKGDVELTDLEMLSLFPGLMSAGHETTANLIGNALWHLLETPERWEQLVAGRYDIPDLVEEMLRFDTSVYGLPRRVVQETTLGGATLPAGDLVFIHFAAAAHDPDQYENPDEFDTSHGARQHLCFGKSAHFCVGAPLARLESRIALEEMAARRPGLRSVTRPTYAPHFVFRGLSDLVVEG
jgi:cytochrome P450